MPDVGNYRTTDYNYEQSSEGGRERHLDIPYSRLTDNAPAMGEPVEVTGLPLGSQITGTVVTLDAGDSVAVINTADGAVYRHNVRTVTTYAGQAESAWRAIALGDMVYYDNSATMPAYAKLSLAPASGIPDANTPFGHVVLMQDEDASDFTKGVAVAPGSTELCGVQQL